jgi:hypothetical protein
MDKNYRYSTERLTEMAEWEIQWLAKVLDHRVKDMTERLQNEHSGVNQLLLNSDIAYAETLLNLIRTEVPAPELVDSLPVVEG